MLLALQCLILRELAVSGSVDSTESNALASVGSVVASSTYVSTNG